MRFRPPWYLRYGWLAIALVRVVELVMDRRAVDLVLAPATVILAALWWLGLDTVVDRTGVSTSGRWFRERIPWRCVRRFALEGANNKPVLVLKDGLRKRLPHVPDSAWLSIQERWQQATTQERA
jgi:hypothetical protein